MSELKLFSDFSSDTIFLSNTYIDEYMPANNESQVKIYLYLLRNISTGYPVSVSSIADAFNYSIQDVERALIFMQNQGLMSLEENNGSIVGLRLLPLSKKAGNTVMPVKKPERSVKADLMMNPVKKPERRTGSSIMNPNRNSDIKQLLFVAEQYIGEPLSSSDVKSITHIYETLGLNEDVVEYLIEYCVSLKKKSFKYIENVAMDWADCGVKTVSDAKALMGNCPKEVYEVFKAFGIKGGSRKPSYSEVWFVNKWTETFGFDNEVIKRACEITIDRTHCASFEYADAILTDWNKKGVRSVSDIERLNVLMKKPSTVKSSQNKTVKIMNQRDIDYEEIERKLLNR